LIFASCVSSSAMILCRKEGPSVVSAKHNHNHRMVIKRKKQLSEGKMIQQETY
jgi:hypothetical protein